MGMYRILRRWGWMSITELWGVEGLWLVHMCVYVYDCLGLEFDSKFWCFRGTWEEGNGSFCMAICARECRGGRTFHGTGEESIYWGEFVIGSTKAWAAVDLQFLVIHRGWVDCLSEKRNMSDCFTNKSRRFTSACFVNQ